MDDKWGGRERHPRLCGLPLWCVRMEYIVDKIANRILISREHTHTNHTQRNSTHNNITPSPHDFTLQRMGIIVCDVGGHSLKTAVWTPASSNSSNGNSNGNGNDDDSSNVSSAISRYPNLLSHPYSQPLTILTSSESFEKVNNTSQLVFRRPVERGYIVDVESGINILGWVMERVRELDRQQQQQQQQR